MPSKPKVDKDDKNDRVRKLRSDFPQVAMENQNGNHVLAKFKTTYQSWRTRFLIDYYWYKPEPRGYFVWSLPTVLGQSEQNLHGTLPRILQRSCT